MFGRTNLCDSPATSPSAGGGHGSHCYDAEDTLICGWSSEHIDKNPDAVDKILHQAIAIWPKAIVSEDHGEFVIYTGVYRS